MSPIDLWISKQWKEQNFIFFLVIVLVGMEHLLRNEVGISHNFFIIISYACLQK